jgi:hypothetical protein
MEINVPQEYLAKYHVAPMEQYESEWSYLITFMAQTDHIEKKAFYAYIKGWPIEQYTPLMDFRAAVRERLNEIEGVG